MSKFLQLISFNDHDSANESKEICGTEDKDEKLLKIKQNNSVGFIVRIMLCCNLALSSNLR
jgi:hypothetical protein